LSRCTNRIFTQEDPIGLAGGLNLYGFAAGDPINFSDPLGLYIESDEADDQECPPDCLTGVFLGVPVMFGGPLTFTGASLNFGLTENGQFFFQLEGSFSAGVGGFIGAGVHGGLINFGQPSSEDLPRQSSSVAFTGMANVGWGPGSAGLTGSVAQDGSWSATSAFAGLGLGAQLSGGLGASKTFAPFPSLMSLMGRSAPTAERTQKCMSAAVGLAPICS
jgi:hypothetical protein